VSLRPETRRSIEVALRRCGVDVTARMVNEVADAIADDVSPGESLRSVDLSEPMLIGWTWKAHLDQLLEDVRAAKWLRASKTLALMLRHTLDKIGEDGKEHRP
jgi:hypothetical protein